MEKASPRNLSRQIIELYHQCKLPTKRIALILGISQTSVKRILKNLGKLRSPREAMKLAYREGRAAPPMYERTTEVRQKISESLKEYYLQHPHPWLGRHFSEQTKVKLTVVHSGTYPSAETRRKMSKAQKVRFTHSQGTMYRKHHTEEARTKMSKAGKGRVFSSEHKSKIAKAMKLRWQDPKYRAKVVPACLKSRHPTDLEAQLIALIKKHDLPYKYTGDGSFRIGRLNPDFVNVNGDKIAIEVFGGHWHQTREPLRSEEGRREILKQYGWKLIVIWGDELRSLPEEAILKRISSG